MPPEAMKSSLPDGKFIMKRAKRGIYAGQHIQFVNKDAMVKDTLERATDPAFDLKGYLQVAYIHPVFKDDDNDRPVAIDEEENSPLVLTKRSPRKNSSGPSKCSSDVGSSPALLG